MWDQLGGGSDYLSPGTPANDVVDRVAAQLAAHVPEGHRGRLIEKSPANSLRVPFLDRLAPGCRIVHIHREPTAAVSSAAARWTYQPDAVHRTAALRQLKKVANVNDALAFGREGVRRITRRTLGIQGTWGPRVPGLATTAKDLGDVEAAAVQWAACVGQATYHGRALGADRYIEVRLEDLSSEVILALLRWLDLRPDTRVLDYHERTWGNEVSKVASHRMSENERVATEAWTAPACALLNADHSFRLGVSAAS